MAQPYQGRDMRLLRGADFYMAVGRKDLADKYKRNDNLKLTVSILGGVTCVVGAALMLDAFRRYEHDRLSGEVDRTDEPSFWSTEQILGWTVAGVGAVMALVPWFISSYPVQGEEARRLVDEHNQKLKAELGLSAGEAPAPSLSHTGSRLILSPTAFASSTGAIFGLAGRY